MVNTIQAEAAGAYAAMDPPRPRVVPAEYSTHPALAAAWLEAYDRTVTAQQCQRPDVMGAPAAPPERKPRAKAPKPAAPPPAAPPAQPKPAARPTMMAIFEGSIAGNG